MSLSCAAIKYFGGFGLKVYSPDSVCIATLKHIYDSAILVAYQGEGATVRHGHRKWETVYTVEHYDEALDSYDKVAMGINEGLDRVEAERRRRRLAKLGRTD